MGEEMEENERKVINTLAIHIRRKCNLLSAQIEINK